MLSHNSMSFNPFASQTQGKPYKNPLQINDIIDCHNLDGLYTGLASVAGILGGSGSIIIERADSNGWDKNSSVSSMYIEKYSGRYYVLDSNSSVGSYTIVDKKFNKTNIISGEFNPKKMDALVIEEEPKNEIIAVLKQHKHAAKLFDEWGLGETIEYGKGMTFLFYGPPGTGKTHAASCIAKAVGREVITVSPAQIQSSEPGGANRAIEEAFATAKSENKILFLDECDSLVSSRADLGMILGSEVNTLLTSIEKFEGILILATNRAENLDAALERRISLIVEFKEPNYAARKDIWERMIPKKLPLDESVTSEWLAEHKLTGGQIKNVLLQAARLALSSESKKLNQNHFDMAIKRLQHSKNLLGSASRYSQTIHCDVAPSPSTITIDKEPALSL